MPSNWLVFDRIRALTRQHRIYRFERVFQDQSNLDRVSAGGDFLDTNSQATILDQTNLQINRLERYKDVEMMDQMGEISLALDLYADEACLTGDTRIPLLDGSCPTIADLAALGPDHEFWVYSFEQKTGKYVPALAKGARVSGKNVPIIKVVLDDGSSIRCTSDHLFMMRNGEFREAGTLNPGDSLKPLYKKKPEVIRHNESLDNSLGVVDVECDNHKVVGVQPDGVASEVYDIEVPEYHCFAAGTESSWVIVHNSLVDPERKHTLVIRARNRRLKRELEELFFNTLQWDTYCRPSVRYLCKYGDMPFEVVLDTNRSSVASLKFMNVYNFTRVETRYGDLIGFFYMDSIWPRPQFLHPWQVMHLRLTSFENLYHPYGRCLNLRTPILVSGGYRELRDLRRGDTVYSFDGLAPRPTTVVDTICSGYKPGITITTKYRQLMVSEDHPILAVMGGDGGRLFRRYVPAKHIVPGSKIIVHDPEFDDTNSYMAEEVTRHESAGRLEVGDIQVSSGLHNFNANGVIVHNSILDGGRKAFKQLRLMEDAALIYRICVRGDTLVWTPTGHTPIKDLKIGDEVYCLKDGHPKITKVVDWQCNGKDVIYRVYSQHREIFCNATHPILVETSYSNKRDKDRPARLEYVDVKDLIVKRNGVAKHHRFILPQVEHRDYVSMQRVAKDGNMPAVFDEQFARWFGFMIGDGFVSERPNSRGSIVRQIGFACGDDEITNEFYKSLFSAYRPDVRLSSTSDRLGCYFVYSKPFCEFMLLNGFIPGAKNKRIPAWVFQSPRSVQEAFIDGYVDADGHRRIFEGGKTEACEIDCCNEMLLRDLKELCHRLGWDVGLVRKHERTGGHEVELGRKMPDNISWSLYFTKTQLPVPKYVVRAGERCSDTSEAILGVEEVGEDLVYDITIEDECHNMLIQGCVTAQTRAPEKRKFTIPVGMIPPKEVPEYMQMIARTFKRQRFYNPTTGSFDERYSPLIQEDDFFLPRRPDGTGPDIDVLPGGENVDKIADIEYFKKKMIAPTKIPFARVGIGEGGGEASEKSLSQSHSEFAKAVQWVQREVATGLTKVAIIHLALRGYSVEDLKGFEIALTATSAMEELYRIETWQTRTGVMTDLKALGWFPKEWIVTHFTDLSPDEIEELKDMEIEATSDMGGGGGGGGGGLDIPAAEPAAPAEPASDPLADGAEMMGMQQENTLPGYDWGAEKRLLLEFKKDNDRVGVKNILQKWAERLGKPSSAEDHQFRSGFQHILETKELDGLSKSQPRFEDDSGIHDPAHDPGLLVEWSVDKNIRDEVIREVYDVITAGESRFPVSRDDEITENDLPTAVSDL